MRNNVEFNDDDQEEMGRLSLSMVEGFCNDSHVKYFLCFVDILSIASLKFSSGKP